MALKKDITDNKGVKVHYHAIRGFEVADGNIKVKLVTYVNQETRDAERKARANNDLFFKFDIETERLKDEVNVLSEKLANGDDSVREQAIELSNQINERVFTTDRPEFSSVVDKHYSEDEVELTYFEPITLEALYAKIASDKKYAGAENI